MSSVQLLRVPRYTRATPFRTPSQDGSIWTFGGQLGTFEPSSRLSRFDLKRRLWVSVTPDGGPQPTARYGHTMIAVNRTLLGTVGVFICPRASLLGDSRSHACNVLSLLTVARRLGCSLCDFNNVWQPTTA